MYHNRINDVVVRMTQLRGLLTDHVKAVVSETIDDHDNYDLVWQRLEEEYGYVSMQSQTKLRKMLDIPSMKSANPKELNNNCTTVSPSWRTEKKSANYRLRATSVS